MRRFVAWGSVLLLAVGAAYVVARGQVATAQPPRRNVIVVVIDGLRPSSVTPTDMPTLSMLRAKGVEFRNSYSLFPTLTMPNASAIATGHGLGDTGTFGNAIWPGFPTFDTGNFNMSTGTPVPFLENDATLGDLDDHAKGNILGEDTLLAVARASGYNTAAIGKIGPVALQDVAALAPVNGEMGPPPVSVIVDDATGTASGVPLSPAVALRLRTQGLSAEAPARNNGYAANSVFNNGRGGTLMANVVQQQWFVDVATRVILPMFDADARNPFVLVYWSRDPDGTQHNQGDSPGTLFPGINGPSSKSALRNADRNLAQLLEWLDAHPVVKANTDIVVTSDHGFATISRREIDRTGRPTSSESARHVYLDQGRVETEVGTLPYGFLAIDLALDLRVNVFDPDHRVLDGGRSPYKRLLLPASGPWEHPVAGNGLLGDAVQKLDGSDAKAIVVANGGSDLVYVPDGNVATVQAIARALLTYDYVGGVFVQDRFGPIDGTLPLSAIGLSGASPLPQPAIIVAFKVFYFNPDSLQTAIQVGDTLLQEGQGVHGGFGRDSTANTMVAFGPDFKESFVDEAPVSNADIFPTLAHLLGLPSSPKGRLTGRVVKEALRNAPAPAAVEIKSMFSTVANGLQTGLFYQEFEGERYAQAACIVPQARRDRTAPGVCR